MDISKKDLELANQCMQRWNSRLREKIEDFMKSYKILLSLQQKYPEMTLKEFQDVTKGHIPLKYADDKNTAIIKKILKTQNDG